MSRLKRAGTETFKLIFAIGLIAWLLQSGKLQFDGLSKLLNPIVLSMGAALIVGSLFFVSERWRILLQTQNISPRPRDTFKLSLIGLFFNFAMPGGVGGDVVKAWYFNKDFKDSKVVAISSVVFDRVIGLYAMILLALLSMLFDLNHVLDHEVLRSLLYGLIGLGLIGTFGLAVLFSTRLAASGLLDKIFAKIPLGAKFKKLYDSLHLYGQSKTALLAAIGLSFLAQFCSISFLWLVANTMSDTAVSFQLVAFAAPLGFIATAIPISPAGLGVGQAAFYYLFNLYSETTTTLGSVSITAFQIAQFILSLAGVFFYLRRKKTSGSLEEIEGFNS